MYIYKCITYYLKIVPSDLCQCQATNVHNKYTYAPAHIRLCLSTHFSLLFSLIRFGCVLVKLFLILRFYYMRHCVTYYTIFLCSSETPTSAIQLELCERETHTIRQSAACVCVCVATMISLDSIRVLVHLKCYWSFGIYGRAR